MGNELVVVGEIIEAGIVVQPKMQTAYDRYAKFFSFGAARQAVMDHIAALPSDATDRKLTRKTYHHALKAFIHYLRAKRVLPDETVIKAYIADLRRQGLASSTIVKRMAAVRHYCQALSSLPLRFDLMEDGRDMFALIDLQKRMEAAARVKNPKAVKTSELSPLYQYGNRLNMLQINMVLGGIDRGTLAGKRDYALLLTGFYGWLRVAELTAIRLADIRQEGDSWVIEVFGKRSKTRLVSVPGQVVTAIKNYVEAYKAAGGNIDNDDPVWKSIGRGGRLMSGRSMGVRSISNIVHQRTKALKDLGIGSIAPHDMRRTGAALAHAAKMPLEYISKQLGHASLDQTMAYIGILPDYKARNLAEYGVMLG